MQDTTTTGKGARQCTYLPEGESSLVVDQRGNPSVRVQLDVFLALLLSRVEIEVLGSVGKIQCLQHGSNLPSVRSAVK